MECQLELEELDRLEPLEAEEFNHLNMVYVLFRAKKELIDLKLTT